jgi:hypothetical protein
VHDAGTSLRLPVRLDQARDLVDELVRCFLRDVGCEERRSALEVAAVLRSTTRDDLAALCLKHPPPNYFSGSPSCPA